MCISVKDIINLVTIKVNIFMIFIFLVSKMFSFEQRLNSTVYAIKLLYLDVSTLWMPTSMNICNLRVWTLAVVCRLREERSCRPDRLITKWTTWIYWMRDYEGTVLSKIYRYTQTTAIEHFRHMSGPFATINEIC